MKKDISSKIFNTRELIGENVVVTSKIPGLKWSGIMFEFFERNNAIVLRDYTVHRMKEGKWEIEDRGDLIIIKGDGWAEIEVPKWSKVK
jgi:hypothetical protein